MDRNYITVSELNFYLNRIIDAEELLHDIFLVGEVSGAGLNKGNLYCTLKDENAAIAVCCFGANKTYVPENGERVLMMGSPDYYQKTGRMSFVAKHIEPFGRGKLHMELEALKKRLTEEGLFSETHKIPMPEFVFELGVVTSKTGAVIRDICSTIRKYNKVMNITVIDVQVQGKDAVKEIVSGLKTADTMGFDAVILARGGGSFEDLMPFNSEEVVRALYDMDTFVISAVGHETDFTLADFAADMRSLTPTAAAEAVATDISALIGDILSDLTLAGRRIENNLKLAGHEITAAVNGMTFAAGEKLTKSFMMTKDLLAKAEKAAVAKFNATEKDVENVVGKLIALNPAKLLKAGYMRAEKAGSPITSAADVAVGDKIKLHAAFGSLDVTVDNIYITEVE